MRVLPLGIAGLPARPLAIEGAHGSRIRGVHPRRRGQPLHILPVLFPCQPMLQRPQRRIRLQHRRVDRQVPTFEQFLLLQGPQQQAEHRLVDLRREPLPDHGEARVVRRPLPQPVVQELPDRQRIRTPRRDRPFTRQILEEAHQQHLEVDLGIDARLPALAGVHVVIGRRQPPDLHPELTRGEHLVESLIKRMRRRRREIARGDPERRRCFRSLLPEHGGLRQLGNWRTTRIAAPI